MAGLDRAAALERLGTQRFDLLVVGGGIVGAGIAEAASAHGLSVALVERGDFGGATSSASSKLIHGGLRYLRLGDVGLVREAHHERRLLMTVVAPHLVRRLPFLFPLYEDGPYRPWFVQTGIVLYSTLARARLNGLVELERAHRMVPQLHGEGLRKCALYEDAWTNDGRLALLNVRAAAAAGAVVANYAEVVAIRAGEGAEVVADGRTIAVRADRVVNASGPWVDRVRRLEDPAAKPSMRLSKGVHVLVDGARDWDAALTISHDKVRVSFAVPWEGMLLLGTTDTPHEGEPEDVRVTPADVEQVLRGGGGRGRRDRRAAGDVLRPACPARRRRRDGERAPRDRLLDRPDGHGQRRGRQADDVPSHRARRARAPRCARPLAPAAAAPRRNRARADRLARRPRSGHEGAPAAPVRLARGRRPRARGGRPVAAGAARPRPPDLRAQDVYARAHEWALTDEDVLRRRTTAWLATAGRASRLGPMARYIRLTAPLVRDGGELRPASWDEALDRAAAGFAAAVERRGRRSASSAARRRRTRSTSPRRSSSRVAFAVNNIDSCNRT